MWESIRRQLFGISPREAEFARRGFHCTSDAAREHLERCGKTFIHGYNAALVCREEGHLSDELGKVAHQLQGFAFEGVAMALALLDGLTPWRHDRFKRFLAGPGGRHVYMVHVGAGWALARLRRRLDRPLARLDPLLRWLVVDGYGFHQGYFSPRRFLSGQNNGLTGYASRAFDFGLGRCLWFANGADVESVVSTLDRFPPARRADLWSGVGLACTYAGGADTDDLAALVKAASGFKPQLAQGAAFAAKARRRAGNTAPHTDPACWMLCGTSSDEAAAVTDEALVDLPSPDGAETAFEVWRRRIQGRFGPSTATSIPVEPQYARL